VILVLLSCDSDSSTPIGKCLLYPLYPLFPPLCCDTWSTQWPLLSHPSYPRRAPLGEPSGLTLKAKINLPKTHAYANRTHHSKATLTTWHERLGHLGVDQIKSMAAKGFILDLDIAEDASEHWCESCVHGKQHRQPFPKSNATRAKDLLEIVHSDVCGPINLPSFTGYRYFITFIDDASRMTSVVSGPGVPGSRSRFPGD
jgi:hypothetical protein